MPDTFSDQVASVVDPIDTLEPQADTFEAQVAGAIKSAPVKKQSQVNLGLAEGVNADTEGKILKLADQSGYDPATVRVAPLKVENQINAYKGGNDQLDDYYAKDPSNAAISGDDSVALTALQFLLPAGGILVKAAIPAIEDFKQTETFRRLSTEELTVGSVAQTVVAATGLGVTSLTRAFSQTMDLVAPLIVDKRKLDFADKNLEKLTVTADLENWLRSKVGDTKFEELLASAVESTATMIAATATGGAPTALTAISYVAALQKITEERAAGTPMTEALLAGAATFGIEYLTEKMALDIMLDPARGFIEKLVRGGIVDMAGELTATALEIFAVDQGILGKEHMTLDEIKQALYETAIVSLMMTSGATTVTHPFVKDDTVTPPPEGDTGKKKTLQELMATADFTPPVQDAVTAPVVSDIVRQDAAVESDKVFHQNLTDIRQAIGETKTNERSPKHMKEVLKSFDMTEDVFISSEGIKSLYQENKESEATAVLESIGVDPVKAQATIATGEDTVVQKATVVTVEEEVYNAIDSYIKQSPASYTKQELSDNKATEEKQNSGVELKETIDRQKQVNTEISRLESEIAKTKLPDAQFAGDAPIILRGLAEKLEGFGLDPVEQLKSIAIKRTPFQEFVEKAKEAGTRLFQDPTDLDFELNQEISTLSARIEKLDATDQGNAQAIESLEMRREEARAKLQERAFADFDTFFQAKGKKRGAITITGEKKLIELFEGADLSTVLHEIGHIALLEYSALERSGLANDELKADMKTIREWVGAKEGADLDRKQSEQFARGFEAYLREGKAPTGALRAAFERFKQYLTTVYKTAQALDVTLNKDIRQVFDRMVAANAEVERAARELGFVAKTDAEMNALGMNEVDKFNAKKLIDKTVNKAKELLTRARNKSLRTLRGNWHAEARDELRNEDLIYDITADIAKSGIDKTELDVIQKEVEAGFKTPPREVRDADGHPTGVWRAGENTFPEYFKDRGFSKKYVLNVINKALTDQKLTEKQVMTLDILVEAYRDETGRRIEEAGGQPVFKEDNRFDRAEFIETYGEDALNNLPNTDILKDNGIPIDQAAFTYGMEDGDALIQRLFSAPPFNEAVDQRVAQKQAAHDATFVVEDYLSDLKSYRDYQELMGRYITGATVDEQAVNDAIQRNVKRWETEARAQAEQEFSQAPQTKKKEMEARIAEIVQEKMEAFRVKQAKPKAMQEAQLKRLAKETMASKTVRDALKVQSYLSAMKKAASDERRAILRKDWGKASTANELGRFNYEMASLSKNIRAEVDKVIDNAKKVGKLKAKETIKNEFKEGILHLISRYNLANLSPRDPSSLPDYAKLFAGDSFGRDGFTTPAFFSGGIQDYRELRVEQLRELDNAIRYLEGQGRVGQEKVLSDGFTLVEDVALDSTEVLDNMKPKKKWEVGSMMRKLNDKIDGWFAQLDSLEFTIKSADNYVNLGKEGTKGVLERYVIDPIKMGLNTLALQQSAIKEEIKPHLEQIRNTNRKWRKQFGRHIKVEGVNLPDALIANKQTKGWFDNQLWAIALNTGNTGDKSNRENLRNGYGMTDGEIDTILNMFTVEDMRAVQGIWDVINSLYAQADAQFLKDNNYHLPKVEATPFTFKGEEFKGGYYPIKHDQNLSRKVKERHVKEDFFDNEGGKITTPFTNKGATNARLAGVALPIRLNLGVIDGHFRDTLHYIHLTDPIRDADRITRYKDDNIDITASISNVLGEKVYDTIRPALQHIANPKREGLDTPGASELEWLRGASTAFILAWNTGVALKQPLSTFGAIHDMGVKAYAEGFLSVLMSPARHQQKMEDLSPYMKNRQTSFDRELKSAFLSLTEEQRGVYFGKTKVTWQDVKNFGFWQIRVADAVTVLPIWHGAFNDKLNSDQSNLRESVSYADDIVRNSQPSAQPFDLSAWQRDGGWHRLFSQFQTFTVGKYGQRQRQHYRAWKQGQISNVDYAWFNFMDAFVPLVGMNMLFALLQGRDLGDDEEQKKMMADVLTSWATMGVPVLGSIARSLSTGWGDPLDTPVLQTGNKLIRGVVSGVKGLDGFENEKEKDRAKWSVAHALSIIMGIPISQIVARAQKGAKQKKGVPVVKYLVPAPKKK